MCPRQRFWTAALACVGVLVSSLAAATDTDVFFPEEDIASEGTAKPNILFLMDTSGSMAGLDGTDRTRLRRVQDALHVVLDDLNQNVNVGLGRLSGSNGGAILFPVSPIDAPVTSVDASITSMQVVEATGGAGNEAQQVDATLTTGPQELQVGNLAAGAAASAVFFIDNIANEAEQYQDDKVDTKGSKDASNRYSSDIELAESSSAVDDIPAYSNGKSRYVGLRYPLSLPAGSTVTRAYLKFTCSATSSSTVQPLSVSIWGEAADNAASFSPVDGNVSSRALINETPVNWSITSRCNGGSTMNSSDLKGIVDAVRARSGWTNGNSLSFILRGSGQQRAFYARQGNTRSRAPQLVVEYISGSSDTRQVGLRFPSVDVPRGVTITSAKLLLRAWPDSDPVRNAQDVTVDVGAEASGNAVGFSAAALPSDRGIAASQAWSVPAFTTAGTSVESPELKSVLQAVVDRSDWCGGQAMALILRASSGGGLRGVYGTAANPDYAPVLSLQYAVNDPALETGCALNQRVSQIVNSSDDAEEFTSSGNVSLVDNDLELGYDGSGTSKRQLVGLRFSQLDVPVGAVVRSAKLTFKNKSTNTSAAVSLRIVGHASDNSPPFEASSYNLSNRLSSPTAASIAWAPASWPSQTFYDSPDITPVVQEIFNRPGWVAGNSLSLLIEPTSTANMRRAYSWEGSASGAAKLTLELESPLGQITVRRYLQHVVDDFVADGYTPLPEMLYEAARYYRGEEALFGKTRGAGATTDSTDGYSQSPDSAHRISHSSSLASSPGTTTPTGCTALNPNAPECAQERIVGTAVYQAPITEEQECTASSIVMLSDGEPNQNEYASVDRIESFIGSSCAYVEGDNSTASGDSAPGAGGGTCGPEIAAFLHDGDQAGDVEGEQPVNTYTIGFADAGASSYLESVANAGGGQFFPATSTGEVVSAFQAIIRDILDVNTSFVAPSVTVNSYNRLAHRDELYFAIFQPQVSIRWPGNLKRYKLDSSTYVIKDVNGADAVDPDTGFFKDDAKSWWTDGAADGADVTAGGAALELTNSRKVLTYPPGAPPAGGVTLTQSTHGLCTDIGGGSCTLNAAITNAMVGLGTSTADDEERGAILRWAAGLDELDEDADSDTHDARQALGDPLHSKPRLLDYGGTEDEPDIEIYYGDNEGYLHAVSADDGRETFSFIPPELLGNLGSFMRNEGNYGSRPQGLDGPITALHKDSNGNGVVDTGERAYLYAGMRRGGRNYYALEVSQRASPKYLFRIEGGTGAYAELGQTWSDAVATTIRYGEGDRDVLIFSGGYDPNQESSMNTAEDGQGRALFIADAVTGELLWWAGPAESGPTKSISSMRYSVPGSPKVIDLDADGLADRVYFEDVSGQVFRLILNPANSGADSLVYRLDRIAVLSAPGGDVADDRRFFVSPDVAMIAEGVEQPFLAVALGSGFREEPLSTSIQDRFFVLRDPDIDRLPTDPVLDSTHVITVDSLYDATENIIGEGSSESDRATATAQLNASDGFFIDMRSGSGEKVISDSQTFDNKVMFSSYEPAGSSGSCQAVQGQSRFYMLSVVDGTPVNESQGDDFGEECEGNCDSSDRSVELHQSGLPPDPATLFPAAAGEVPDRAVVCIGAECLDPGLTLTTFKAYWTKQR